MKKFTFRLETLLKVRKMREEEAQIRFSQATAAYLSEKDKENSLQHSMDLTTNEFRSKQQQVLTVETLKNYHYFIDKIKEELEKQRVLTRQALEHKNLCMAELENAIRNRKLVEKLKEKQWQEYQEQLLRGEQAVLDEMGATLYSKNN